MQVPERLALIGGSILLASTLVFTLKSQASHILPKVSDGIGSVYQDLTNTQAEHGGLSFDDALKNAQKQNWRTGTWGTSKWYIDNHQNLHIGSGRLSGNLYSAIGHDNAHQIQTINLDENIQAPQNSDNLFTGRNPNVGPDGDTNKSITDINGLERLDTSQVTDMNDMFYRDYALTGDLAVNGWDVSNVQNMEGMFGQTNIQTINVKNWDVRNNTKFGWMFAFNQSLDHLDLSNWHTDNLNSSLDMFASDTNLKELNMANFDTTNAGRMEDMFGNNSAPWDLANGSLSKITLGDRTQLRTNEGLSGTWKNGDQTLSSSELTSSGLNGNPTHPGTWVKQ